VKSSCAAEFLAASAAADEIMLTIKIFVDVGIPICPVALRVDNQAAVKVLQDPITDASTKYVHIHHLFVRKLVRDGRIKPVWGIGNTQQLADVFTKPLAGPKMAEFRMRLSLRE
jgi:hypothetical protein